MARHPHRRLEDRDGRLPHGLVHRVRLDAKCRHRNDAASLFPSIESRRWRSSRVDGVDAATRIHVRYTTQATIQEQPVSTTHCQIGAVTAVALASLGCKHVQWSMLGKILVSWILTIPTSAVIAAIILWIFRPAVCASCPWS